MILVSIGVGGTYAIIKNNDSKVSNNTANTTNTIVLNENSSETEKVQDKDNIIDIKSNADYNKLYENVDDLSTDAEVIVKGTVLETTSYISGPGVITEYKLRVETAYKNAKEGDVITIATAGGTVPCEEYVNARNSK